MASIASKRHRKEIPAAQIPHSVETGEPFDFESRCRRYDGVLRWFQARCLPLRNPQGQIERWYVLLIDIEDKRQTEDALRNTERTLSLMIINARSAPSKS